GGPHSAVLLERDRHLLAHSAGRRAQQQRSVSVERSAFVSVEGKPDARGVRAGRDHEVVLQVVGRAVVHGVDARVHPARANPGAAGAASKDRGGRLTVAATSRREGVRDNRVWIPANDARTTSRARGQTHANWRAGMETWGCGAIGATSRISERSSTGKGEIES